MHTTASPVEAKDALEALQQRSINAIVGRIKGLSKDEYGDGVHKTKRRLLDSYARLRKTIASPSEGRIEASSKDARVRTASTASPREEGGTGVLPRRAMGRPARTPGDAGHSPRPWSVGEAGTAVLRGTAPWSGLPAVLAALVRGYLDGNWIVLLSGEMHDASDAVAVYATASVELWDELPTVANTPGDDDDCDALQWMETHLHACIADEAALAEERFSVKGPWTRLRDLCTPRTTVEAAVCVRGELVVYGGTRPAAKDGGREDTRLGMDRQGTPYVDATERLSLSEGRWRTATHANDGGEYAAAYASVAAAARYSVAAATLSELAPKGDPLHECVRIYYGKAQCLSFGEGETLAGVHGGARGLLSGAAVLAALALPPAAFVFSVCRLARAADHHGDAAVRTSVRGASDGMWAAAIDNFHYLLDEATGRRTVAAASVQQAGRAVALPNGEMLVFGGVWDAPDAHRGNVEIYSPDTDSWRLARWTVPDYPRPSRSRVLDALLAGGLLHVLFERHILIARLDPADAAAPVEWRVLHLPYGMRRGTLVHVAPQHYTSR